MLPPLEERKQEEWSKGEVAKVAGTIHTRPGHLAVHAGSNEKPVEGVKQRTK